LLRFLLFDFSVLRYVNLVHIPNLLRWIRYFLVHKQYRHSFFSFLFFFSFFYKQSKFIKKGAPNNTCSYFQTSSMKFLKVTTGHDCFLCISLCCMWPIRTNFVTDMINFMKTVHPVSGSGQLNQLQLCLVFSSFIGFSNV